MINQKQIIKKYYLSIFLPMMFLICTGTFAQTTLHNTGYESSTILSTPPDVTINFENAQTFSGVDNSVTAPND